MSQATPSGEVSSPFTFTGSSDHQEWLDRVVEEVIEPELPIIDAHHHLWVREPPPYLLREFVSDLATGHNVVATVFAECHSMYRQDGPEEMKPVGESEFVSGVAAMSDSGSFGPTRVCRAMVGSVDFLLGSAIGPVIDAHETASGGRFRGVRLSAAWHEAPELYSVVDDPERLRDPRVREALVVLADRGHSLDCWIYHTQIDQLVEVAAALPDLSIVVNHTGVPILGGPFRGRDDAVFEQWRADLERLAAHPNVVMKLGALPVRSRDRSDPGRPPSSDDIVAAWGRWIEASIELFGPERCMFETNFPVHKRWCSYPVLWNAFKKMASDRTAAEKADLFAGTAARVYRVDLD